MSKITINTPFIKDSTNIKWLEENWETFLDYMAKRHSLVDCWHTVLNPSSFDDAYVSNMIKDVEKADKQEIREKQKRKRKLEGKTTDTDPNATVIEKKQAMIEEAVAAKQKAKVDEGDLID